MFIFQNLLHIQILKIRFAKEREAYFKWKYLIGIDEGLSTRWCQSITFRSYNLDL